MVQSPRPKRRRAFAELDKSIPRIQRASRRKNSPGSVASLELPFVYYVSAVCVLLKMDSGAQLTKRKDSRARRPSPALKEERMSRYFDHIDLRVPRMSEAAHFYEMLMPALGFKRRVAVEG